MMRRSRPRWPLLAWAGRLPRISLIPPVEAWRADLAGLPIDAARGEVLANGRRRRLRPQEQAVLAVLLCRPLASRDALMTALWGVWLDPPDSASTMLRVRLRGLRQALDGAGAVILSERGRGWRLVVVANDNRRRAAALQGDG
jgi:DNA-binding response OmpR family regulator